MSPALACVLRAGTTMLRVTKVDDLRVQPFTVFGWQVADIRTTVAQLTRQGVVMVRYDGMDQDRGWGMGHAWGRPRSLVPRSRWQHTVSYAVRPLTPDEQSDL
jgi:hypothetical protein